MTFSIFLGFSVKYTKKTSLHKGIVLAVMTDGKPTIGSINIAIDHNMKWSVSILIQQPNGNFYLLQASA